MSQQTKSLMIIVALLVSSIGCVQLSHRHGRPSIKGSAQVQLDFSEAPFRYQTETLKLNHFFRAELLTKEALPEYYLTAFEKLQKIEVKDLNSFQEFNRLQNVITGYHAQRLVLGIKHRQKTALKMHRFLADLKRHEDHVAELQSQCFTLLQQKQQQQVAFLFADDAH